MEPTAPFDLTLAIDGWLRQLHQKRRFRADDLEELRSHLLDQADDLIGCGKSAEQAFRLATSQLGEPEYLAKEYRKVRYWYVAKQKVWALSQLMITSRRVVAFSMVFVAITFGSIFGQKPSSKRSGVEAAKGLPKTDTIRKDISSQQLLFK